MGLLDDAIREHLDLKRRRGADPAEIERAEREALGPVGRDFGSPDAVNFTGSGEAAAPDIEDEAEEPGATEHFTDHGAVSLGPDYLRDESTTVESADSHEPFDHSSEHGKDAPGAEADRGNHLDAEPLSAGSPKADAPDQAEAATPGWPDEHSIEPSGEDPAGPGDTEEFDVERSLDHGHDDEHGDVLEETPEFLQDTPDHDRLWFEQRPPRDFDFDG
jgi:hypothetical protein